MSGPTPRRLWKYVTPRLRLASYFQRPGDGRQAPQIPAQALVWGLVLGHRLREDAVAGVEALVRSGARRALAVARGFSDDTLAYFTERLDPGPTRQALGAVARQAKRNKALAGRGWIGLALDGTRTTCVAKPQADCAYCRPLHTAAQGLLGYRHEVAVLSLAGAGVTLPWDAEPYGPGDSEYAAGQRLVQRTVGQLGRRFADYVVADGEFSRAPFLHTVGALGLHAVVRLKENLPELFEAAQQRYAGQPPTATFVEGRDHVEVWDAGDFDPWETLRWETVRVLKHRQTKPDGRVYEALWLTDWSMAEVGSQALYRMAKSRWAAIENETFNVAKTYHRMEHICHHQGNSLLVSWLILLLALAIERLYRLRYLHRGRHPVRAAMDLVRAFRLSLGRSFTADTS
jgi:hypothetical protein